MGRQNSKSMGGREANIGPKIKQTLPYNPT